MDGVTEMLYSSSYMTWKCGISRDNKNETKQILGC